MKNRTLKILCCAVYFFSYISRQNYSAVLPEMIKDMEISKALAGVAITGSFISYGAFQIISGFWGDKFKPEKIIFIGLFGSSLVNILIWLFPNIYFMNVIWCFNGALQSLIWPPLVRLIVDKFDEKEYSVTIVRISQASYGATVSVYLLVPAIIWALNWKWAFAFSGIITMAFSFLWLWKTKGLYSDKNSPDLSQKVDSVQNESKIKYSTLVSAGFIPIIISTIAAGFMRDGIATWMPTYISEVYGISTFTSILTGAVLPVVCALFLDVLNIIGSKIGNELKASSLFFAVAATCSFVLFLFFSKAPFFDVAMMALITLCIHGVNLMLVCNIPKRFAKYGKTSTMTGVLNAAIYSGAAISAWGNAAFASAYGWRSVTVLWIAVIIISMILCFAWKSKYEKNLSE